MRRDLIGDFTGRFLRIEVSSVMKTAELVELALIPMVGTGLQWAGSALPPQIELGHLLLGASALLLFQTLVRDLWLVAKSRRRAAAAPPRIAKCMCVESIVGITGIIIGLALFSWPIGKPISMGRWTWSAFSMLVLAAGFVMKDYVLEAKPWRLRRDKDHVNIIVKWKR